MPVIPMSPMGPNRESSPAPSRGEAPDPIHFAMALATMADQAKAAKAQKEAK